MRIWIILQCILEWILKCFILQISFGFYSWLLVYNILLYTGENPASLMVQFFLNKSLCLPENWYKLTFKVKKEENQLKLVSRSKYFGTSAISPSKELK